MLPLILILAAQILLTDASPGGTPPEDVVTVSANAGAGANSTSDGRRFDDFTDNDESDVEWVDLRTGFNQTISSALGKRATDLGGTRTPKGGRYPAGYTATGGYVHECPNQYWEFDGFPPYDTKCKRYKIEEGKCYKKEWKNGFNTLVPDKELSCDYYATTNCMEPPEARIYKYEGDFNEFHLDSKEERDFLRGKVIRKMYGVRFPCCETFQDANGYKWRMMRDWDAPGSFKCFFLKGAKGLVTREEIAY